MINVRRGIRLCLKSVLPLPGNLKAILRGVELGKGSKFSWGAKVFTASNSKVSFGKNCRILTGVIISPHPNGSITFGDNCSINPYCLIYGHGGLQVGNNVRIAAHTTIVPANHRYIIENEEMIHTDLDRLGIVIGNDVWIGAGVRILDGVEIVSKTIVGAGAVVSQSLQVPGIYGGVPAKLIKHHSFR